MNVNMFLEYGITVIFPDRPGTPRALRVTDIWKDYVQIIWEVASEDGGSPITGYNIEVRDAFEVSFKFVGSVNADTTSYQVR